MKLVRVISQTGTVTAEAEHTFGLHHIYDAAWFSFSRFGRGKVNRSDMRVHVPIEDAIAVIEFYAAKGDTRAVQMLDDAKLGAEVRQMVERQRLRAEK